MCHFSTPIEFCNLNLIYYDESILFALSSAVGNPIKVDSNVLDVKRGKFSWVCEEIDLCKLVVRKVWLHGHWYHVEYKGLHEFVLSVGAMVILVGNNVNLFL